MRQLLLVAAVVGQSGCAAIVVEVQARHPAPHELVPRGVSSLKTYQARPDGGVAVYGLQAQGEDLVEVEAAIRQKAASLGCDGIMFAVRADQSKSVGESLTGQLNEHHEYVDAHVDALCMVDPAAIPDGCPGVGGPRSTLAAAMTAPGDIEGTARGVLDQWRLAYESRNTEALARLYAHDASLSVVEDGGRRLGWTEVEPMLRDRLGKASSLHIRIEDVQIRAQGTTAIVVATVLRERSAPDASTDRGVLTLVLRAPEAGDAGWVIVAEHDSHRGS